MDAVGRLRLQHLQAVCRGVLRGDRYQAILLDVAIRIIVRDWRIIHHLVGQTSSAGDEWRTPIMVLLPKTDMLFIPF